MGKQGKTPNPCLGAVLTKVPYPAPWYGVRLPFTPSNTQLKRYALQQEQRVVVNKEGGVTFDEAALRVMRRRYPGDRLYQSIDQYREYEKCLGTYVEGLRPEGDGRYREEFRHIPKTLRLAMRLLQLLPRAEEEKAGSVYGRVRGLVVAAEGKTLLTRDFSGIEGALVAYLGRDRDLLRLCFIDVHGFLASHAIGRGVDLSGGDADLKATLGLLKTRNESFQVAGGLTFSYDQIRTACKRAFYLSLYAGTPRTMVEKEPQIFPSLAVAKWYQDLIYGTFPSIQQWQWATCEEAETHGFLTAPSGFRLWFPDGVFEYAFLKTKGKWVKRVGEVAKECIAAKPQHLGFLFSARALQRAAGVPILAEGLRLSIHDELWGEYDLDRVAEANVQLKQVMEVPMPEMPLPEAWGMGRHLRIQTEGKMGVRWSEMKKVAG